jgi:hypothetical protein
LLNINSELFQVAAYEDVDYAGELNDNLREQLMQGQSAVTHLC